MAGRRTLPYTVEAEERVPTRPGRHKTPWRDRPRHFPNLEAAGTFAAHRASTTQHRQRVCLETGVQMFPGQSHAWTVRPMPGQVLLMHAPAGTNAAFTDALRRSLDRMAREA